MIHMPPETLWLGNVGDVRDVKGVLNEGIRAIVDLAVNEPVPTLPREIVYCRIPLVDASGNPAELIRTAIHTTASLLREQIPTLVYCSVGASRAPAIAACAVALLRNQTPRDVLASWAGAVPMDVSPALWADLPAAMNGASEV